MKHLTALISLLITTFHVAQACSCSEYHLDLPIEAFEATRHLGTYTPTDDQHLIFHGKVLSMNPVEFKSARGYKEVKCEMTFQVFKYYQGKNKDTVVVLTNYGSAACGYSTQLNANSIIFASKNEHGTFSTWRSDCCKSAAQFDDDERYNRYLRFLTVMGYMENGRYRFTQRKSFWAPEKNQKVGALCFTIRKGKFHGKWTAMDRYGRILETGVYKHGVKIGTWEKNTYSHIDKHPNKTEKTNYVDGRIARTTIETSSNKR